MGLITETEHSSLGDAAGAAARGRFSVVDASARVGRGTVVGPHVFIDARAIIGEHCVFESGAQRLAGAGGDQSGRADRRRHSIVASVAIGAMAVVRRPNR
jgi:UDP-3-O-[3-hydroxymyristoyl] glucosamine N-acyltransferase